MAHLIRRPSSSLGLSAFDEFDKLFDDLWQAPTSLASMVRVPSLDIYSEDDKHMVVEMQVPGFDRDDIAIDVRNGILEVRGEISSRNEQKDKKRSYIMRESHASFARRIALPEGASADTISAELDKGILKITVPVDRPEAKRVEIFTGSQGNSKRLTSRN